MSDQTAREALRAVGFFHDIAEEHLDRLAEIARVVEFPAESEMFHEYDTAKDVYVIITGQVSLVTLAPKFGWRQLMKVGDGELVGWSPLLGRDYLSDTARTVKPTTAIAIDGETLLAFCREHPQFGFEFMHRAANVLAQRLSATRSQIREISGFELPTEPIESD